MINIISAINPVASKQVGEQYQTTRPSVALDSNITMYYNAPRDEPSKKLSSTAIAPPPRSRPREVSNPGRHGDPRRHRQEQPRRSLRVQDSQDSLTAILVNDGDDTSPPSSPSSSIGRHSCQPITPASQIYVSPPCSPKGQLILMDSSPEREDERHPCDKTIIAAPALMTFLQFEDGDAPIDEHLQAWSPPQSPQGPHNVTTSSGPICRICHEGDQQEALVSVCKCSGTVGLLHVSCLERWLNNRNTDRCEICQQRFPMAAGDAQRQFSEWICGSSNHRRLQRTLVGDLLCCFLLTPIAAISTFLCVRGATRQALADHFWEAASLVTLATLLVAAYMAWSFLTVRFHYRSFLVWKTRNHSTHIVVPGPVARASGPQPHELVDVAAVGGAATPRSPSPPPRIAGHAEPHTSYAAGFLPAIAFWE
ncbi:unnamed protein product [Ixodes pacificus]